MIRRLDRYVLGRFLTAFLFVAVVCVLIFTVFDFTMRVAAFMREGFSAWRMLQFYLYFVPELLVLLMPAIVILAVAWSIGRLERGNEITAMRASGISLARIGGPIFVMCAALACMVFVLNERVVTKTHAYVRQENLLLRKKPAKEVLNELYFYTDDQGGLLYFRRYDVKEKVMSKLWWKRPLTAESPELYVTAERAEWLDGQWWLFGNVQVTRTDRLGNEYPSPAHDKRIMYEWNLPPEYVTGQKGAQEMTLGELNRAIRRDREFQPERALAYRLEWHDKLALPLLTLVMLPLSFPFVVRMGGRRQRTAAALGVSLLLCFGYYLFYAAVVAVVRKWVPVPAIVWIPNLAYTGGAVVMLLKMK